MPGTICIVCKENLILDEEEICAQCELSNDNGKAIEIHNNLNCGSCNVLVEEDSEGLYCDVCDRWFHNACCENPLIEDLYCLLNGAPNNVKWFCDKCIWITEKWIESFPTIALNQKRGRSRRMKTAMNSFKTLIAADPEYDYTKEPEVKIEIENEDVQFDINDGHSADSEEYTERKKVKKKRKLKKIIDDKDRIYKCSFCERAFTQQMLLNRHCRRVHAGLEPFKCFDNDCGKMFFRENKLKIHERTHTGKKPFPCSLCDKSFSREGWLEKHQIIHTSDKPFQCRDCEICFDQQDLLKEHRKTHIGDKIYQCSHCGQVFARRRKLKIHERIHTGEKPYKCNFCEKCFGNPDTHKKHQRTHSESKIYQCSHCGKGFARHDHLKKHEIIHTGEKPHQCTQCGKVFHRKDHLRKHEKYHIGEKPYQCSYCGKDFVRRDNLKAHERIHTGEKPNKSSSPRSKPISSTSLKSLQQPTTGTPNKFHINAVPIVTQPNSNLPVSTTSMSGPSRNSNLPVSTTSMSGPSRNSQSSNNPTMPSPNEYTIPMTSPFLQSRPILNSSSTHPTPHFAPFHQMPIRLMTNQQLSQIEGWSNVGRWVNSGNWGNYEDSN